MTELEKWMTKSNAATLRNTLNPVRSNRGVAPKRRSWVTSLLENVEQRRIAARRIGDEQALEAENDRLRYHIGELERQIKVMEGEEQRTGRHYEQQIVTREGHIDEMKEAIYA